MEPLRLIGQPMDTDQHRRRYVKRLDGSAPLRDQLTVPCEHDCLDWSWRDVNRDLPTTVVSESLGDEVSRDRRHPRSVSLRGADALVWVTLAGALLPLQSSSSYQRARQPRSTRPPRDQPPPRRRRRLPT